VCCGDVAGKEDRRAASRALTTMKDDNMALLRRTCATCCAYSGGECMNRVSFIVPGADARQPLPNEVCDAHMTQRESNAEDAAIAVF
jgi:hypothetical protein